jgi:Hypoxia induced protein conserved region
MATSADDIANALAAVKPVAADPSVSASAASGGHSNKSRVRVRPLEDYESATEPSFHVDYADGGREEKNDKLRKNPLVPLSALATAGILAGGLFQFKRGNAVWSQRLMRARIVAQGTTLALLAGSVYTLKADDSSSSH